MKKKLILGVVSAIILCTVAVLVVINSKTEASDVKDRTTVFNIGAKNREKYVTGEDKDSVVEKTAKKVDTDPSSITVLVNKEYKVPKDYKPDDLVEPNIEFSFNYKDEKRMLRKEAAKYLEALFQGAKKAGYDLLGVSAYRSYERQKMIYEYNLMEYGYDYTQEYSAMPGTSEHQTGLAIDISCKRMSGLLKSSFGETAEGKWVQANAYRYGYIVRYSKNKTNITGYGYEPWHIRYVGEDLAKLLHDNNMTLDEYYEYILNSDLIDREQYAYYDALLTRKDEGKEDYSQAILDDLLSDTDVQDSELEEDDDFITPDPGDVMDGLEDVPEPPIGFEEEDMPPIEDIETTEEPTPTEAPTVKPTAEPEKPTQNPPSPKPDEGQDGNVEDNEDQE
ncbi:MAG: hypothetical protein E7262_03470 [Lachnospiraceae bacterium]|nr:hypothetical protein [Lachnospiraceae bacterium]